MRIECTLADFKSLAQEYQVIPVLARIPITTQTPLATYLNLKIEGQPSFLFESADSSSKSGRYSILGGKSHWVLKSYIDSMQITDCETGESEEIPLEQGSQHADVLQTLESTLKIYGKIAPIPEDLPFYGGAVGYISYEAIQQFEPTVTINAKDDLQVPRGCFFLADEVVVFDHEQQEIFLVAQAFLQEGDDLESAYTKIEQTFSRLEEVLNNTQALPIIDANLEVTTPTAQSNTTQEQYEAMVAKVKEYILAGDVFQTVPSQRFNLPYTGNPQNLYRALRQINPSPYMFILDLNDFCLVGSSPEVHVRLTNKRIDIRPIAGTRWRGQSEAEDLALEQDLLADEKERAEHLMLVDLARNDVGRMAEAGSVKVDDFMIVERYSHVMHLVSNVSGTLADDKTAFDILKSTFPAGTVSGSPKIRAMQIIGEIEQAQRGAYSGAVGYFAWNGNHDSCIALRTCLLKDNQVYIQAGAGVVADSNPTYEYEETCNKAKGMFKAVALAQAISKQESTQGKEASSC